MMKDKAYNSRKRGKYELIQGYKSYADYSFTNDETCHQRCKDSLDSVISTPTNDEYKLPNWKYLLKNCTVCTSIALPGVERDSSNRASIITFNTYMTQFTCSCHGILIRETITTYLDAKGIY